MPTENTAGRRSRLSFPLHVTLMAALALALSAGRLQADTYVQTNLVSDVAGTAANTDPHLMGAWGATRSATGPWWVNSTIGGTSIVYDGSGKSFPATNPLIVTIPPPAGMTVPSVPTGLVTNSGTDFTVGPNQPARFIFVTRTGTISGWNPQANPTTAVIKVDHGGSADYTGVALAQRNGVDMLYVANFASGQIELYDGTFSPVSLASGAFVDREADASLSVFNIQAINGELYVTYAPKNIFTPSGGGRGQGHVAVFDANGMLVRRLRSGPWMNAPWGVTLAPAGFGRLSGHVLVGMFGDGTIAAFDATNGEFHGRVHGSKQHPLTLAKGLWGLGFGNGANAGPATSLYFAADIVTNGQFHGLFGTITVAPDDDNNQAGDGSDTDSGGDTHSGGD